MIKKVRLHNFQSHRDSELALENGINSIVGLSDSGKSSFLRALKCILYRDSFYLRAFEEEGYIEVEFDNGIVRREKQISFPKKCPSCKEKIEKIQKCKCGTLLDPSIVYDRYVVNGEVKEKFGAKLPDFIKNILKFTETNFVDFEVALQFFSQHEDMFFIGNSYAGGARNKIMSCLVPDSDKIDVLLKKTGTDLQEKKILSESLLLENIQLENKIKAGKDLSVEVEETEKEAQEIDSRLYVNSSKLQRLKELYLNIQKTGIRKHIDKIQAISKNMTQMKDFYEKRIEKEEQRLSRIRYLSKLPVRYNDVPTVEIPEFDISGLDTLKLKISKLKSIQMQLQAEYMKSERYIAEKIQIESNISNVKEKYNECLGKEICPVIQDKYCESCVKKLRM